MHSDPNLLSDITIVAPTGEGALSPRDAAAELVRYRRGRKPQAAKAPDAVRAAGSSDVAGSADLADLAAPPAGDEPIPNSAPDPDRADAAPQDEAPGATTDHAEPETLPPLEPPRSWNKDARERFAALPRETQEYLLSREQERDREVRQSQNEAAEQRKLLAAERRSAQEARAHYEGALPVLLQTLVQQANEFPDIRTFADVERLAREDWPRYVLWDAQQKKINAVEQELKATLARQNQETQQRFAHFAREQDTLIHEKVPELADRAQAGKAAEGAVAMLKDLGFDDHELGEMWNGRQALSLRDHRVQLLIRDGVRYREAQAAAKAAAAKSVPQVQRPGAASSRNADLDARLNALDQRLERSGSLKDAAALLVARRSARR
jgi:hypothetical protein